MAGLQDSAVVNYNDDQLEFTLAKPFETVKDESDEQETEESIAHNKVIRNMSRFNKSNDCDKLERR